MKILLATFAILMFVSTTAQTTFLDLIAIPDSVKKRASVIKQSENTVFEVTNIDRATLDAQETYTVMSEEGKGVLFFSQESTKWMTLDEAEIRVFDLMGKQVNKYKKKDMTTVAIGDGLVEDGALTYFRVPASSYPITVEYRYKLKFSGTLFYPDYVIRRSGESVVNSTFTARVPKELDLRYREKNIQLKPVITDDGKMKVYQWTVHNMPPVEYEEGASKSRNPTIVLAPNKFSLYGHEGDLTSWNSFGQWLSSLYTGMDVLPDDRKQFYRDMVKDAKTDKEKARLIYDYLQKNFRYVSIQLGIGGYKPFPADFTDQKKYGDCKGLSNFMKAALAAVGVKSYVAIVNAEYNSEPVDPAFPENGFNHVILCVPQPKDSFWLECTSNLVDFTTLGTFTEDRNALLVTESGGVLVHTPSSKCTENTLYSQTVVNIMDDGSGTTKTTFHPTGEFKEKMFDVLKDKEDDKKEFVVNDLGVKQPDEFVLAEEKSNGDPSVNLEMKIEKIPEFRAGTKMFINPRLYKLFTTNMPKSENRRLDYYFQYPYKKNDTTVFKLPDGYLPDALPGVKDMKCEYATYTTKYWFSEKERAVYSVTMLILLKNKIPAAKYASVKSFFDEVLMDNNQKLVIKKS
jgi:hypothetical protein